MSGRTKQPSFGGVAALFGEDDEEPAAAPAKSKKKQPSFGGVAGLFGEDDGDDGVGAVSAAPTGKKKKAAPSFGGVAAMFGDDGEDEKPPSQIITKPKKPAGRQASFGGVAALFGDDDDDGAGPAAPSQKNRGKQASFGGVAGLFGTEEVASVGSKVTGKTANKGTRQQSFGGVASLFGTSGEEEDEPAAPSKGISDLFSGGKGASSSSSKSSEGIGALPKKENKGKQRKGKRDPSVSGIASLFGDDDDDEQPDLKSEKQDSGVKEAEIHKDLKNQTQALQQRAKQTEMQLDLQKSKTADLEMRIQKLQATRDALAKSKQKLAQMTAVEMDRMRSIILAGYTAPSSETAKAATVS